MGLLNILFSPNCKINRARFLLGWFIGQVFPILIFAIFGTIEIIDAVKAGEPGYHPADLSTLKAISTIIIIPWFIIFPWSFIVLAIKRIHDMNLSGWLCLLRLIPFADIIIFFWLACAPGAKGANNYGPDPLETMPVSNV